MSSPAVQPILTLLACPVGGNPTQYAVEKAFAHHGLDWRYLTLEVTPDDLHDAVRGMRAMGFRGGSVADPHRRSILPLLDGSSDTAHLLGRVNLILGEEKRLVGDNTEGRGLVESLRHATDPAGKKCLILDAGDFARAVAVELAASGASEIRFVDPSIERAAEAAGLLAGKYPATATPLLWDQDFRIPEDIDVVVQAASRLMHEAQQHPSIDLANLRPELIIVDVAVDPEAAWLLHAAAGRGCRTLDGLSVLVEQVAVDFRLWTLLDPDRQLLRESIEEFLEL